MRLVAGNGSRSVKIWPEGPLNLQAFGRQNFMTISKIHEKNLQKYPAFFLGGGVRSEMNTSRQVIRVIRSCGFITQNDNQMAAKFQQSPFFQSKYFLDEKQTTDDLKNFKLKKKKHEFWRHEN